METIISAVITGAVAIVVCMVNNASQSKRNEEQHNKTVALIEYKLDQLERKVDKHNNFAARMPVVEQEIKSIEEKMHIYHNEK